MLSHFCVSVIEAAARLAARERMCGARRSYVARCRREAFSHGSEQLHVPRLLPFDASGYVLDRWRRGITAAARRAAREVIYVEHL